MTFELVYTRRAADDVASLDTVTRKRIGKKILALETGPIAKSKKLSNAKIGNYRFRIGDYRVIFDISGSKVLLLRIGHRREVYR